MKIRPVGICIAVAEYNCEAARICGDKNHTPLVAKVDIAICSRLTIKAWPCDLLELFSSFSVSVFDLQ